MEKICPLIWAHTCEWDSPNTCLGARCAWYVPPSDPHDEGRCAVQVLALKQEKEDSMEHTTLKPVAPGVSGNDHTYYTVAQVAQRYGVSTRVVYKALSSGAIHGARIGGWRISEEALQEFERNGSFTAQRGGAKTSVTSSGRTRRKKPIITKISL